MLADILRGLTARSAGRTRTFRRLEVSVVVVVYNIPRAAPRMLLSLSAEYQRYISPEDYEVIVVDNGSNPPLDKQALAGLPGNFRLIRIDKASPSPVLALNRGLAEARGDTIGVMMDGARMATPGLLHFARHGVRLYDRAVVCALGWYVGFDYQRFAMQAGYNEAAEDALLDSIDWPHDGYRLFEIGTMDESSVNGWLAPISESNGLFLSRDSWERLGGLDERFDLPGGGLANLDTYRRAVELPDAERVILLGEATFHQLHGGVATNIPAAELGRNWALWSGQYEAIRGRPYEVPNPERPPTFLGTLPRSALARFVRSALYPLSHHPAPLGAQFDPTLWSAAAPVPPSDPVTAALVDLAHAEFRAGHFPAAAAVARLVRERAPHEPEPQRLLALTGSTLPTGEPPLHLRAEYHRALGSAYRLLGEEERARESEKAALG